MLQVDPYRHGLVYSALAFLARGVCSARPVVVSGSRKKKTYTSTHRHPVIDLLRNPNPWIDGTSFLKHLVLEVFGSRTGDAFCAKARSPQGGVIGLLVLPGREFRAVDPQRTGRPEAWQYVGAGTSGPKIDPSELIHFRNGIDPDEPSRGLSDFAYLTRELATEAQLSAMTAGLARNMGVPGVVIAPKPGEAMNPDDAEAIRQSFILRTSGDNAGKPLVLSGGVNVTRLPFTPAEMDLNKLGRSTAERIVAALGLNLAGLGIRDSRLTHQNVGEGIRSNWVNGVRPLAGALAETLTHQLLRPDYPGPKDQRIEFDFSDCHVFAKDRLTEAHRVGKLYTNGVIQRDEARATLGFSALGDDDGGFVKSQPPTRQSMWDRWVNGLSPAVKAMLAPYRPGNESTKVLAIKRSQSASGRDSHNS